MKNPLTEAFTVKLANGGKKKQRRIEKKRKSGLEQVVSDWPTGIC